MTDRKVWFVTGAGRGMGVDIAQAALAAGHVVVATGRNTEAVIDALGQVDDPLVVQLDITSLSSAEAAVQTALDCFGRIDVLVNNAGNFYAGFFEELSPEQFKRQLATNLVGQLNVTRVVLPVMRKQRSGHIITMSSTAGIVGQEFCSSYSASKFGVRVGWSRFGSMSSPSASEPQSWSRGSSAPRYSKRSQRSGPSCPSTTTPSAPPRLAPLGRQ
jgi:NAD(P)-dependent dehydrogenase (short-subunit alcohol dehydrogenase family)